MNQELIKEVEKRSEGILKDIAIDILLQIKEENHSDEAIRTSIKRKIDVIVREENK